MASLSFILVLLIPLTFAGHNSPAEAQIKSCSKTSIPSNLVTANGNDGNIPQNTVDNNLNTRWSNLGFPSWIQYDLGAPGIICYVDVAWYRGDLRVNTFMISVSEDNVNFQTILKLRKSSGLTSGFERYDVPDTNARYVRITVTGSSENSWASISEAAIYADKAASPCVSHSVYRVAALRYDGFVPKNTLDNNLGTRWTNFGLPSSISYDYGTTKTVCDMDIAWYRGDRRVNTFTISASNDNVNYFTIGSGKSSGLTSGFERYNFPDTNARYLRITITENTEGDHASISEFKVNAGKISPTPQPPPAGGSDPFGIRKIYPTKAGGEEWFMDMTDGQDARSRPPSMTKNPDGSFKVTSSQVRYGVFTGSGYQPERVVLDHGILAQRGYMQSTNDWKNVELTGYVKVNSGQSGENFAWYARGGRHTGSGNPEGCEGSAYKPDLYYDGRVRFSKEQWHVSYDFTDHKRPMSSIEDRWVGFKGIMWNMEQNGETVVKMEIWVDKNEDGKQDGPWVKVDENIDSGGWGDSDGECGGEPDQIITWGGPIATFRWDGASDVDIKNFSVRA
jgi:hypothetical protein